MNVVEGMKIVARVLNEYGLPTEENQVHNILWGETGFPWWWDIPKDGATPEECLRTQVQRYADSLYSPACESCAATKSMLLAAEVRIKELEACLVREIDRAKNGRLAFQQVILKLQSKLEKAEARK